MNVLKRLSNTLLIRENELPHVGYFLLLFFLIGLGLALGRASADALFFKRYGFKYLPVMYVILSGFLMAITMLYAAYADRLASERLFRVFFGVLACLLVGNWALMTLGQVENAYPLYFLVFEVASDLLVLHFGLYVQQNFETLQAKRLMPIIFAGAQVGSIVGGLSLTVIAKPLGVQNLPLLWCALVLVALLVLNARHRRHGGSPLYRPGRKSGGQLAQSVNQIVQGLKFARRSPLVLWSSGALFFTVITFYILCYSVNRLYATTFKTEEALTAFFGMLAAGTSAMALLMQLFLTNRLLRRFGVRGVNLVFPATTFLSFVFMIGAYALPAAIFASVNKDTFMKAFRNPVRSLLFNAIPNYMQGRARALAAGLVLPVALALTGGILLLAQARPNPVYFLAAGLTTAAFYFYFNTRTNHAYVAGLVNVLREKIFLPDSQFDKALRAGGQGVFDEMARGVAHEDDRLALAYATRLARLFPEQATEVILQRMVQAVPAVQHEMLRLLLPLNATALHEYLWRELQSANDRLRATMLEHLFTLRDQRARALVEETLASANPRLRAVGIYGVRQFGIASLAHTATQALQALLASSEAGANIAGLEQLAASPQVTEQEALARLLNHSEARVRVAALTALARWPSSFAGLAESLRHLSVDPDPAIRAGAIRASRLLPCVERSALAISAMEDGEASVREAAAGMLVNDERRVVEELAAWIEAGRGSARAQHAVLTVLLARNPSRSVLERLGEHKARDARLCSAAHDIVHAARQSGTAKGAFELLEFVLAERVTQHIQLALRAVEHVEDPVTVRVIRAGLRSGDRRNMANACESVRNLANKRLAAELGDLLEGAEPGRRIQALPFQDIAGVVAWCAGRNDPWLRDCALRSQADWPEAA